MGQPIVQGLDDAIRPALKQPVARTGRQADIVPFSDRHSRQPRLRQRQIRVPIKGRPC